MVSGRSLGIVHAAARRMEKSTKRLSFTFMIAAALALTSFPLVPQRRRGSFELNVLDVAKVIRCFSFSLRTTQSWSMETVFSAIRRTAARRMDLIPARKPSPPILLKVGHHGSKNSSIPDFLAAVEPRLAVISSGEGNCYRHPSPQLVERLQAAGVSLLRQTLTARFTFLRNKSGSFVLRGVPANHGFR